MSRDEVACQFYDGCPHRRAGKRGRHSSVTCCRCSWEEWIELHPERWPQVALIAANLSLRVGAQYEALVLPSAVVAVRDWTPGRGTLTGFAQVIFRAETSRRYRDEGDGRGRNAHFEPLPMGDRLVDARACRSAVREAEIAEERAQAADRVAGLDRLDRLVLEMRFEQGMTLSQLGEMFGVGKARAHAMVAEVLAKLRVNSKEQDDP